MQLNCQQFVKTPLGLLLVSPASTVPRNPIGQGPEVPSTPCPPIAEQHSSAAFRMEYIGEVFEINFIHSVRAWTTLMLLGSVFLLSGCNTNEYNMNNVENPPPGTSQRNNLPTELPKPIIQSVSGSPIPAVQGSYCWEGLCIDYAGDLELLEGRTPVTLLVGEDVSIDMGTDVAPDEIYSSRICGWKSSSRVIYSGIIPAGTGNGHSLLWSICKLVLSQRF
ncbi:hypothetical protein [Paenibacillus sp. 7516]|uniref:hypothetical protein n=1 Tax=Paenibacillus sp. 7516 TaxID=2022549 RepID=UPI000BA55566|nr:hypothetical protein [Paenibacillus sp. 7516]